LTLSFNHQRRLVEIDPSNLNQVGCLLSLLDSGPSLHSWRYPQLGLQEIDTYCAARYYAGP